MVIKYIPLLLLLSGCATLQNVNVCKHAPEARIALKSTIAGIQIVIADKQAHGKPVDAAITTSLDVATASLTALDMRCPDVATN